MRQRFTRAPWLRAFGGTLVAVTALAGAHANGAASGQDQLFRTSAHVVPIYATVTDAAGALVPDLTRDDFIVNDNGVRQPLTVFSADVQSFNMALMVDRSPSVFPIAERIQAAVSAFVERLLPSDRTCLGSFGHVVALTPELTADPATLLRHLDDPMPFPAGTAMWDAVDAGRAAVASEGGRRVVLVLTDAADNSSVVDVDVLRTALEREGVMLYGVGLQGREGIQARELRAITRATGGWYFELRPTDDLAAATQRVADELHRQYLLGFAAQKLDDRIHRVDVTIGRPGLSVRARRSYVASSHAELH